MKPTDLPDRLDQAADHAEEPLAWLLAEASDRICDLEAQLLRLRAAIVQHRSRRDWIGGKESCDRDLWSHIADVPWGPAPKGDG